MRIKQQEEILSLQVRKQIIEEIQAAENKQRKDEAYRRSQCFKDKTSYEVHKLLLQMFSTDTVREMSYAITNLSIVKKVIKKLARVYKDGVMRSVPNDEQNTEKVHNLEEKLHFNERVKSQNNMLRLQKNALMYVKPCKFIDNDGEEFWRPRPTVLHPYLYDVVEDFYDRTQPMVYILSDYRPNEPIYTTIDPARVRASSTSGSLNGQVRPIGNGTDEKIADKKEDEMLDDGKEYIWWSGKYHFTTNGLGQVIRADGTVDGAPTFEPNDDEGFNPIEELPMANIAKDQDNSYWAEGGEDLIDGAITVNALMTQSNHIAVTQGYGQYWMAGKNLPENVEVGPNRLVKMEHEIAEVDPAPQFGVVNANPPLSELQDSIESQVAMILTTNNLSTSGISGSLDGGSNFASGIALIIDKSESLEDVHDDRQLFADAERRIWKLIAKFMQFFSEEQMLDPDLQEDLIPEDIEVVLEFNEPRVIASEGEKLDALTKRKNLGINTDEELIMIDRPDYDEDMAKMKIEEIRQQKQDNMAMFMDEMPAEGEELDGNQDDENEGNIEPDDE